MKLLPFKDLIAMSKEKMDEALAGPRARLVKSKAETEMAHLETEILTKQQAVQELFAKKDINFPDVMDKLDDIALLERRQEQYNEILVQLFPEDKAA